MPVQHSGNIYSFCSKSSDIEDALPNNVFDVCFSPTAGWYLQKTTLPPAEKMFGAMEDKIPKVLSAFKRREGNTGIILSGDKGLGKTLFARHLCSAVLDAGYPVLKITSYMPGITDFIAGIEQPLMLFFDEFAKIFPTRGDDDDGAQTSFLTLLDGTACGKRLTVVTCNTNDSLSSFFTNRPGRFYYNFFFDYPKIDVVKQFLAAQGVKDKGLIEKLSTLSSLVNMNFDSLRAISEEIVQGYSVEETLEDLNLKDSRAGKTVRWVARDENGLVWASDDENFRYLSFTLNLSSSAPNVETWHPVLKSGSVKGKADKKKVKEHDFIIGFDTSRLRPRGNGAYELIHHKKGDSLGEVRDTDGDRATRYKAKLVDVKMYDAYKRDTAGLQQSMDLLD